MKDYNLIARPSQKHGCGNLLIWKKSVMIILALIVFNCSENPETFIPHLEGYWEITEVIMSDGSKKEYKFNETIDYISVSDSLIGFRKKLKPGINDTYFTSGDAETLEIKIENDSLNIHYSTPFSKWKETVLDATAESLTVINENKTVYLYKRYTSIKLDLE